MRMFCVPHTEVVFMYLQTLQPCDRNCVLRKLRGRNLIHCCNSQGRRDTRGSTKETECKKSRFAVEGWGDYLIVLSSIWTIYSVRDLEWGCNVLEYSSDFWRGVTEEIPGNPQGSRYLGRESNRPLSDYKYRALLLHWRAWLKGVYCEGAKKWTPWDFKGLLHLRILETLQSARVQTRV
jgi:hypothetical protein